VHLSGTTGAVSLTSAVHGNHAINVDGGSTVTVNTTSIVDNAAIIIGATTKATGAVAVTSNLNGDGAAALDQGDITVNGGSTVTVNSNLTITAKNETASAAHTFGDVRVNSNGSTTAVTINQTYAETEFTKAAVPVVRELHTVTFGALAVGQTTTVDGLTFTASKALTAAEVASAFSNLTASDTQTSGGLVANGVFTGNLTANFTSGAASGAVVVFTAHDHSEVLSLAAGVVDPTATTVAGTAAVAATTSANSAPFGAVRVDGATATTDSITTLALNGYGAADLGNTGHDLNALTTLSLANSGGTATVGTSAAALALTVNNVNNDLVLSGAASLKTLNVTATGANSTFGLNAPAVQTLTVAGDRMLDIDTNSTLTALRAVTVTGTAGLSINATGLVDQASFDTTGTTGTVTAIIDGRLARYTGGAGVDNVTLTVANPTQAINLGAGDDTLTLASATNTSTLVLEGGEGTDTLVLTAADAQTNSATDPFETKINSFERLTIGNAATKEVVNLANLDDISYVRLGTSAGTAQVNTITVGGPIEAGDVFTVTVNGIAYSFTAADTVAGNVATGLRNALAPTGLTVAGAVGDITLTAPIAGVPFTVSVATTETNGASSDGQTLGNNATTANTSNGITLNNLANNGTVVLTNTGSVIANIKDATTGTADVLNVLATSSAGTNYGILTANKVETINITVDDTDNTAAGDQGTLLLAADSLTRITVANSGDTVVVGTTSQPDNTKLNLTVTGATALTAVDASAMRGSFTYTADDGTTTVTGGAGNDTLTGSGNSDVLIGGAGNDTFFGANLTILTGGAGNDTFMMNRPANVNSFSSITDLAAGDRIDLDAGNAGTVVFTRSATVLAGTAVFQDFANAAVNALGADANDAAWFQFGGNTFIVQSGNATLNNDFVSGSDSIIQIVGLVDLSTASYNQSFGVLEIV